MKMYLIICILIKYVLTQENALDLNKYERSKDTYAYDFNTEKFLNSSIGIITSVEELRQNNDDGSTLHIQIDLK